MRDEREGGIVSPWSSLLALGREEGLLEKREEHSRLIHKIISLSQSPESEAAWGKDVACLLSYGKHHQDLN